MSVRLANYASQPRMARVFTSKESFSSDSHAYPERVLVEARRLTFQTDEDAACYELRDGCPPPSFAEGDIVVADRRGIVQRVYDAADDNITIFVTGRCNSNCIMCPCSDYERQSDDGWSDEWLEAYISMLPHYIRYVVVTGGEPTLKTEQFFKVMRLIADRFPQAEVLLLSNGRSFASRRIMEQLSSHCPPHLTVGIPIHGSTEVLHDAITQTRQSFRQTCQGIRNILLEGIEVELRVVVSRLNHKDLLKIAQLVIREFPAVGSVKFMALEVRGSCATNFDACYIDPRQSWADVKPAVDTLTRAGIAVELYNYQLCAVERGYWALCRQSITPYKVRFAPACEGCALKEQCCGFFGTTLRMAKPVVRPIANHGQERFHA